MTIFSGVDDIDFGVREYPSDDVSLYIRDTEGIQWWPEPKMMDLGWHRKAPSLLFDCETNFKCQWSILLRLYK